MATIESLDLATLTNNPQSIAEALEDALETTNGTIGQLKTDAQSKKDDIDDLYDDALTAKNSIDSLLSSADSTEEYHTTSFDNSWVSWYFQSQITGEDGLRIQRYGKLYVVHLSIYKTYTTGEFNSKIKTLSSTDITLPTNDVNLGIAAPYYGSGEYDQVARVLLGSNGDVTVYGYGPTGNTFHLLANFIGIDLG
tara:strand:+ start:140 stop:724 length:585 start_codon:yes stop_codon:yes gene_type:complete